MDRITDNFWNQSKQAYLSVMKQIALNNNYKVEHPDKIDITAGEVTIKDKAHYDEWIKKGMESTVIVEAKALPEYKVIEADTKEEAMAAIMEDYHNNSDSLVDVMACTKLPNLSMEDVVSVWAILLYRVEGDRVIRRFMEGGDEELYWTGGEIDIENS